MSNIKNKIIHLLSLYPEEEFYAQEIAEKLRCSKSSAVVILKDLTSKKIVHKKEKGHMKFYQINEKNIEVKRLKIDFTIKALHPLLSRLGKISQEIVLFGSSSRGEETFNSDIDLLIITNSKKEVKENIDKVAPKKRIQAIIKTPSEWAEVETKNPELYKEVYRGIVLQKNVSGI